MLTVPANISTSITNNWPGYGTANDLPPYSFASFCLTSSGSPTCTGTGPIPLYNPVDLYGGYDGTGQDQHTSTIAVAGNGHNCQLAEQYQAHVVAGAWQDTQHGLLA